MDLNAICNPHPLATETEKTEHGCFGFMADASDRSMSETRLCPRGFDDLDWVGGGIVEYGSY
jgi:hypothetical protein